MSRLLYKQNADTIEYLLLLLMLICGAIASGAALTHQIGNEFSAITRGF
ncbi:MAG: hypothetical protein ACLGXA_09775 [Acidobacteriota bacterium]